MSLTTARKALILLPTCRCGEMADAQDLKSWDLKSRVGSSPTTGTSSNCACSHESGAGTSATDSDAQKLGCLRSGGNYSFSSRAPAGYFYCMVRFVIDIEGDAADPEAVNIMLKTQRSEPTEAEETAARRLLPALRDLPKNKFPEDAEDVPSPVNKE